MDIKKEWAPCSSCVRHTTHEVLFETKREHQGRDDNTYKLLSCGGCGTVSMMHVWTGTEWFEDVDGNKGKPVNVHYYPSPVSRKEPEWVAESEGKLISLLQEIYQAIDGGQYRLAAMGIRALLEQVMIAKVGDLRTFDEKLDAFQRAGFISLIQRDAMRATLDVGDAAMHRAFVPTDRDLNTSLDIAEGVMAAIYCHQEAAENMGNRVPPRKPKPGTPGTIKTQSFRRGPRLIE
jgi:Domain of unknown function (DUF4145)